MLNAMDPKDPKVLVSADCSLISSEVNAMDPKDPKVLLSADCSLISSEVGPSSHLDKVEYFKEEKYQACPLCKSEVRLFYVNFTEKLLMCENTECEFPFGYEDLQFVTMNSEDDIKSEINDIISKRSLPSTTPTCTLSEIDERSTICDSEIKSQCELNTLKTDIKQDKNKISPDEKLAIEQKLQEICKIGGKKKKDRTIIKDENFIKNLMKMQETSGVQLLDPSEIQLVQPSEPKEPQEIKINIRNDPGNMYSIDLTIDAGV